LNHPVETGDGFDNSVITQPHGEREKIRGGVMGDIAVGLGLGSREQQIVELLLQGCDNEEIARQLNMARPAL